MSTDQPIRIAGISGSLRRGSYNTATLRAAVELRPEGMEIDVIELHGVPLYNADVEAQGWPPAVAELRRRIEPAHGLLIASPEYNYSIPGVLKNAIDWLSRPERETPIYGKPVAIVGATPSMIGTARAQAHLRQIAFYNAMPLLASEEILIARASDKFDGEGRLVDDDTRKRLAAMLETFRAWVRLNRGLT